MMIADFFYFISRLTAFEVETEKHERAQLAFEAELEKVKLRSSVKSN